MGKRTITRFATQHVASLLAFLAFYRHQSHPREVLYEMLWPGVAPKDGRSRLSNALWSLRRQLEPLGTPAGSILQTNRLAAGLNPAAVTTDVAEFLAAVKEAERARDTAKRTDWLRFALTLYRGELLPGFYEDWVITEQRHLAALAEQARDELSEQTGRAYLSSVSYAPDTAEPDAAGRAGQEEPRDAAITADHRAGALAGGLPVTFTRFFGREEEITALTRLLTAPDVPLVTLSGAGGTGKTRLAIKAAERLASLYQGAIWFVGLADLADPSLIAGAIRDAMRLPASPHEPLQQVVAALSEKPSLLVLDNFEHLVEEGAYLVQTLLERVPALTCLVTSRQVLGLSAEREYPVLPLPTPGGPDTPERLSLVDSVRLFVDRAQAVKHDFQVTGHNAPAVAELCNRLEGIPLAIELAAVRAQVTTPSQMLAQLQNRFAFLAANHRRRDAPERHRTLRAAIEWSYRLLSPDLQRFFCRLSVFRGGWTADAAEAVCEEPLALDYLAQLRGCSLVLAEETDPSVADLRFRMLETLREFGQKQMTPEESFALHRQYASYFVETPAYATPPDDRDRAFDADVDNLRAVFRWCQQNPHAGLVILHCATSYSVRRPKLSQARIVEGEPLRETWVAGAIIACILAPFHEVRGNWRERLEMLEWGVARATESPDIMFLCHLAVGAGKAASLLGQEKRARAHYERAVEAALQWQPGMVLPWFLEVLDGLGLSGPSGDHARALRLLDEYDRIVRALPTPNPGAEVWALIYRANIHLWQGDYAVATALLRRGLELAEQRARWIWVEVLLALGRLAAEQGDFETARAYAEQVPDGHQQRRIVFLADLALDSGDYAAAQAHYTRALDDYQAMGNRKMAAEMLAGLGRVAYGRGDFGAARAFFDQSLVRYREMGGVSQSARLLLLQAEISLREGDAGAARRLGEQGVALLGHGDQDDGEGEGAKTGGEGLAAGPAVAQRLFGLLALHDGDLTRARAHLRRDLSDARAMRDRRRVAGCLEQLAWVEQRDGRAEPAVRLLGAADLVREILRHTRLPIDEGGYNAALSALQSDLAEGAFTASWSAGRSLTWEQAVAYALEGT